MQIEYDDFVFDMVLMFGVELALVNYYRPLFIDVMMMFFCVCGNYLFFQLSDDCTENLWW